MTFTVDKDVWVHGVEVPSQVTDVPEELTVSEKLLVALINFIMMVIIFIVIADGPTCYVTIINWLSSPLSPSSLSKQSSQMGMMDVPVEGLPIITCSGSGYNELLYAHLLDNEVPRQISLKYHERIFDR